MTNVDKVLEDNMDRIKKEYDLPDVIDDTVTIERSEEDYIFYLCYKLNYWLNENIIYKVCGYFDTLAKYMEKNQIDFTTLDESCQIVITAAKYYVRGVLRVKEVYHL